MNPVEYRSVIKFLVKDGLDLQSTIAKLQKVYKNESPSESTITRLHREFRLGRTNVMDEPRSGAP